MNKPIGTPFQHYESEVEDYIGYFHNFLNDSGINIDEKWKKKLDIVFNRISENFDGKSRQSGEPYITHLIEVAKIFIDLVGVSNISLDDIIIALLHDSIEDIAHENFHNIQKDFGDDIALGVLALSKPESNNKKTRNEEYYDRFQSIESLTDFIIKKSGVENISLEYESSEKLARLVAKIKLCDRIHNLRTMKLKDKKNDKKGFSPEKKQEKLTESTRYFSNILREIGNEAIASEFTKSVLFGTQSLIGYAQRKIIHTSS